MEKKLITEMKFMMERLENPRMTYTEYEKRHKSLIKEDVSTQDVLNWAENTFKDELTKNSDASIEIDGENIIFDNGSSKPSNLDFSGEKFAESGKSYKVGYLSKIIEIGKDELENFVVGMKKYLSRK